MPRLPFLAPTALLLAGCVSEGADAGGHVYRYATWVPLLGVLAAAGSGVGAWFLRRANLAVAGGLAMLSLGILVLIPSPASHEVRVDQDGFRCVAGPWWSLERKEVHFEDLREIRRVVETDENSLGKETPYRRLLCVTWSGEEIRIPRGELVAEAEDRIVSAATEAGVEVIGSW